MKQEEIKTLLEEINIPVKASPSDEDVLYSLSQHEGWRLLMRFFKERQAGLLEPVNASQLTPDTNLETLGAMALARSARLEELRTLVGYVESVRMVRDLQNENREEK